MRTRRFDNGTPESRKEFTSSDIDVKINKSFAVIEHAIRTNVSPFVSLSGGIHSCITAYLVNKVAKRIPAVFNDWGIMLPDNPAKTFCKEFCKKYEIELVISGCDFTSAKEFVEDFGYPIFKAIRSFIPKRRWSEYGITDKCREAKHKCRKNFVREHECDLLFTGIMCNESTMRMQNYIKYGYFMPVSDDGITICKPIIHFKQEETMDIVHKYDILINRQSAINFSTGEFDEDRYVKAPSLFECALCGHDFKKKGFGKLGLVFRERKKFFVDIWDNGLKKSFEKMANDYPNHRELKDFINYIESKR